MRLLLDCNLGTWAVWCFLKWINSDNGYIQVQCFNLCKTCSKHIGEDDGDNDDDDEINIHDHVHAPPPPPPYAV